MASVMFLEYGISWAHVLTQAGTADSDDDGLIEGEVGFFDDLSIFERPLRMVLDAFDLPAPIAVEALDSRWPPLPCAPRCLLPRYGKSHIPQRAYRPRTFSHVQSRRHKRKRWLQSLRSEE